MQLTEHFGLSEFTVTNTGLPNLPSEIELDRIKRLAGLLEEVREVLGHPIMISSGFRSEAVNRAAGGVDNSAHRLGLAADFTCPGYGTPESVCMAIIDAGGLHWDQLINEYRINSTSNGGDWVHLGLGAKNRQQVLTRLPDGRYTPGIHGANNNG